MKRLSFIVATFFASSSVLAYSVEDLANQLPSFFPDEVKEEWLEKQEEKKSDRRERLRQIRLQRLEREEEKKSFDPEEVLRQQEEREAYQKWLEEQEEVKRKKALEQQRKVLDKKAAQSMEEIEKALVKLDELEKELKEKFEADLERIESRRFFLTEKLEELAEGDYSTGVKITNTDNAIDLESRFLENMMVSPTETPAREDFQPEERVSPMNYRERMKMYYRQKDLGVENGKLSTQQKLRQMRSLKTRTDYNEANLNRAQKLQRALQNRNQTRTSSPTRMSEAVLRALKNRSRD